MNHLPFSAAKQTLPRRDGNLDVIKKTSWINTSSSFLIECEFLLYFLPLGCFNNSFYERWLRVFQSTQQTHLVWKQLDDIDGQPACVGLSVIIADCCKTSLNDCICRLIMSAPEIQLSRHIAHIETKRSIGADTGSAWGQGGWLPDGNGMTACGKKPGRSADLGARSFILTVQSVEEGKF